MKRQVENEAGVMLDLGTDKPLVSMNLLEKAQFKGVSLFGNRIHLLDKEPQTAIERIHKTLGAGSVTPLDIRERPLSM